MGSQQIKPLVLAAGLPKVEAREELGQATIKESGLGDKTGVVKEDDATLVARCLRGDGSAWTVLVERYERLVFAIVRRVGLNQQSAEDVFQTVFMRLFENLSRVADPNRLQAWIVTTAKREALLQRRRSLREVPLTGSPANDGSEVAWDLTDTSPIPEDELEALGEANRVREAIGRLDERGRTLLELLYQSRDDKLSYEEISDRLGIPVGSIGPTRSRTLEKLRRLLA